MYTNLYLITFAMKKIFMIISNIAIIMGILLFVLTGVKYARYAFVVMVISDLLVIIFKWISQYIHDEYILKGVNEIGKDK